MDDFDVVIIGGGAAGLSAALTLGRSRRSVLVVDSGEPRNAPAEGVHNLLGQEGTPPRELARIGRAEAARYGVLTEAGRIVGATRTTVTDPDADPVAFRLELEDGRAVRARRIVLASGAIDVLPDVPGLAEQWGRGVVHCPYCHGWEVRDRTVGVLMTSSMQTHQAHLFRQLTDDVVVFVTDPALADADARARMTARGIRIVDGPVFEVLSTDGILSGVRTSDGIVPVDAVAVTSSVEARLDPVAGLGLTPVDQEVQGQRFGSVVAVGPTGETTVRGVYAAGNVTNVATVVIAASAAGTGVGAAVNLDLVTADVELAMTARTAPDLSADQRLGAPGSSR